VSATDVPLEFWQAASVAYDTHVCGGQTGRAKTDPVYQEVCEGRDAPPNYQYMSTCADRCHAKLWRFGCRLPFVNREERSPLPNDWHMGANVSQLHDLKRGSPCLFATNAKGQRFPVPPGADWVPSPGDELLIWNTGNDAHSLSIVSFDGTEAVTGNYGSSGMSKAVFPGAKLSQAPLTFDGKVWRYGKPGKVKIVQRVIRLVDAIPTFTVKPNFEGIPFDAAYTGEVRDRIEAAFA
jgi:hypothetical protein